MLSCDFINKINHILTKIKPEHFFLQYYSSSRKRSLGSLKKNFISKQFFLFIWNERGNILKKTFLVESKTLCDIINIRQSPNLGTKPVPEQTFINY